MSRKLHPLRHRRGSSDGVRPLRPYHTLPAVGNERNEHLAVGGYGINRLSGNDRAYNVVYLFVEDKPRSALSSSATEELVITLDKLDQIPVVSDPDSSSTVNLVYGEPYSILRLSAPNSTRA